MVGPRKFFEFPPEKYLRPLMRRDFESLRSLLWEDSNNYHISSSALFLTMIGAVVTPIRQFYKFPTKKYSEPLQDYRLIFKLDEDTNRLAIIMEVYEYLDPFSAIKLPNKKQAVISKEANLAAHQVESWYRMVMGMDFWSEVEKETKKAADYDFYGVFSSDVVRRVKKDMERNPA